MTSSELTEKATSTALFRPLVSIVIPVYNGANYMREAIDSALSQTYDNVEIIVVNDGSRDGGETDAIARSYVERIRYFSKENGGCASALNHGIANMRGDYFSWLSHDDVYLPDKVEHQVRILSELPDRETILYGPYEVIDAQSKPIAVVRPEAVQPADKLDIPLFPLLRGLIHGCSMLVPVRYFRQIGVFDVNLPSTQDYALWFKFLRVAPIHYDPRILIRSRVHPEQGTHKIATHVAECNQLWIGFLNQLTLDEMSEMEGTPHRFFVKTAQFLSSTPYREAQRLAEDRAKEALEKTLVSVVVPCRDPVEQTLETVRSALSQSHRDIEIVLVDDGSTEGREALQSFAKTDPRIRCVRQDRAGPAKARNFGVAQAQGQYIAFLDPGDLFHPEKVETQLAYMEEKGLALCHTSYERIDGQGRTVGVVDSGRFAGGVFPGIIAASPIATSTVMGLASLLTANPFPEGLECAAEHCLWIRLTRQHELGGLDVALTRVRGGPESQAGDIHKQVVAALEVAGYLVRDPVLYQYGKSLRTLLQRTRRLVPDVDGPEVEMPEGTDPRKGSPLPVRAIRFVRQHGWGAALRHLAMNRGR